MTREMTNRAVTVARMSGGPGQDRELSHGRQDNLMFGYCKKIGLDVIKPFYEVASGLDASKRPTLLEVMEFVLDPANMISHVVFPDLSRFSRSKSDPQTYLKLLDDNDIIIHSAVDGTTSDDDNELYWDVSFLFNHEYSKTISRLTIGGQSQSVRNGNDISPVVAYGYEKYYVVEKENEGKEGKEVARQRPRWRPHPKHSEVVLLIFTMRDQKYLPMAICNHLNGLGIKAPRGGLWTTKTIINILRNLAYIGYSQVGKKSLSQFPKHRRKRELVQNPNAHPAIVPEDLFHRVQALMPKKPRAQREPPRSHASPNPLSDRVKCGKCQRNANMIIANSKSDGGKKLICSVKKNSGVAYCDSEDIELDDFLKTVGESMKERLSAPSIIQEQMETLAKNSEERVAREKDRQALKAKRLKEIDQEKANLMRGLAKAEEEFPENVQDFNQSLSRLNKEKEQINQQQQDMDEETSELMAFLADPEGVLEALQELGDRIDPDDLEVTSRFLKSIVNLVEVSDDDAEMYYSVPLPNTVETTAGYKAPARIKRAGHSLLLGISDPAHAGIDRCLVERYGAEARFPRTRGDRPRCQALDPEMDRVPPLTRAIGGTLEFRFPFPKQADAGGRPSRKSRAQQDSNLADHCVNRGKPIGTVTANIAEPNKLHGPT